MEVPAHTGNATPLVAVHMITYNHGKYAAKAIESVLNQKTDFKVKLLICDDCSKDNTEEVCRSYQKLYPDLIDYERNPTNIGPAPNGTKNVLRCFASGAKYIAVLDADDYWCDNLKLQKQVDLLRQHGDKYSVCFTDVDYVDDDDNVTTEKFISKYYQQKGYADQGDVLTYMPLPTQTTLIDADDLHRTLPADFGKIYNADGYFYGLLTQHKTALYLNEVTACYRTHGGGMMSGIGEINRWKKTLESLYFLHRKGILNSTAKERVEKRVLFLQTEMLNNLINEGLVSVYFREFFNYLRISIVFNRWDQPALHISRFFRVVFRTMKEKIGLK